MVVSDLWLRNDGPPMLGIRFSADTAPRFYPIVSALVRIHDDTTPCPASHQFHLLELAD